MKKRKISTAILMGLALSLLFTSSLPSVAAEHIPGPIHIPPLSTSGIHDVSVKITRIVELNSPEKRSSEGSGDYYANVKIDNKWHKMSELDYISGKDIRPNWEFTSSYDINDQYIVPIVIELFDYDPDSKNERMDISNNGDKIDLEFDLRTQKWSGDVLFPSKQSQGDGKHSARVYFDIFSKSTQEIAGIHDVSVKITRIVELNSPEKRGQGSGDYYANVKIDNKWHKMSELDYISGTNIRPDWEFNWFKDTKKGYIVPIVIELFDYDPDSKNERMDISNNGDKIDLEFDLRTQRWSGDVLFPSKQSQGDGKHSARVYFDIFSRQGSDPDNDGIPNSIDNCDYTSNYEQLDMDKDGIGDVCDDSDNDGIYDSNDKCPNIWGHRTGKGCYDPDGDGLVRSDRCPNEYGPRILKGCPLVRLPSVPGIDFRIDRNDNVIGDPDSDLKFGGKDPITIGKWSYIEPGNDHKCANSPNPFDYDNDGFKEHMCYWYSPQTKILFVDFNGNRQLDNGYELLQSDGYNTSLDILKISPDLCVYSDCYIWMDKNSNILVDDNELEPFRDSFNLSEVRAYSKGKLSNDVYLQEGRERGFFIYGEAEDENLGKLYATKPTYWMKGI